MFTFTAVYAGSNNGSQCSPTSGNFFNFPSWYEYLPGQKETTQFSPNSPSTTKCVPLVNNIGDVWLIVAAVIDMLLWVAGIGAVFMVIYGGVKYTTSMGEPDATAQARNTIIYALVGLLLAISASLLVTFIAKSVGAT